MKSFPHRTRFSLLLLCLFLFQTGCASTAAWYRRGNRRPYPSKRYTPYWCFELPRQKVANTLAKMLKDSRFKFVSKDTTKGSFVLQPAHLSHYSRNPHVGHELTLRIRMEEEKGKLNIGKYPKWALTNGKIPRPDIKKFKMNTLDGVQKYQQAQTKILNLQVQASAFMKKWKGCNVRTSTLRTRVFVEVKVKRYLYGPFNSVDKRTLKSIPSDKTMEVTLLRRLAYLLKRRPPRVIYY